MIDSNEFEFTDYRHYISGTVPEIFAVPENIDGHPVTSIGARAFYGCRGLKQVILPPTVEVIGDYAFAECRELEKLHFAPATKAIGDYAFYNCMGLKEISLDKNIRTIGYGAFKNCLEMHKIFLKIRQGDGNCLNAILQDEFQEVDVAIDYVDAAGSLLSRAMLVFTDYQYEYVPEIEARQFNWETYGSGDSYRISIRDREIDYLKYDSVFSLAMVEDDPQTLQKIAGGRLCYPHKLTEENRRKYESYVTAHRSEILKNILSVQPSPTDNGQRFLDYMLEHRLLDRDSLEYALELCRKYEHPQITAQLMAYDRKNQKATKPAADIKRRFAL